eukprot:GHVT01025774.1.p1 GENE.GHVT01025774.1~~GHVT01025774.1.p1  ORF type:complete len:192 (+),score=1.92 GHVT01025774.1:311-886(+)
MQLVIAVGITALEGRDDRTDTVVFSVLKFAIGLLILDTYQFWHHLLMHKSRTLFRLFHSWHHSMYCPYAVGALYNHPVEGLLLDAGSGALSVILTNMDMRTATLFVILSTLKTICDHSNYHMWWNPLMSLCSNNAAYHDYHHQLKGFRHNFEQPWFTFWDKILGTTHYPAGKDNNRPEIFASYVKSTKNTQ